jgi:GntR family transcriptional regulator/MocR family aminotransferase
MDPHISLAGGGDLTARIYRQLLDAILDGRLRPGERLPPTRELARSLQVSRNTVAVAYERLTAEGFLTGRVGAGTYVAQASGELTRSAPRGSVVQPARRWREPVLVDRTERRVRYDFTVGVPDVGLFPLATWRRLVGAALQPPALRAATYADPGGHAGLREGIARYLGVSRSVRASAGDVLVTQGAQQALDLIGRVLIEPGTCVAVEDPGYPPARLLFRSLGARVVGVPVDDEGLSVSALPARARLVYTTPSHQFPLGTPMSLERRTALLAWAERHNAVVIEDDYDSEFRYGTRPLEPLQSLDRSGRVIYVGSFSKTLLPMMLRLGFLVASESLQPALLSAKQLTDWHGDLTTQAAMARFIDEGLLARHVRKATKVYAARHELVTDTLSTKLAGVLQLVPSAAGLHVCARTAGGSLDVDQVVAAAAARDVRVESLAAYAGTEPGEHGLVVGFGAVQTADVKPGLRQLVAAVRARP